MTKAFNDYEKLSVTVDNIVTTLFDNVAKVLLVTRRTEPYVGKYALVGGFMQVYETGFDTTNRVLETKSGLVRDKLSIEQLGMYTELNRDPRGRVLSIANIVYVKNNVLQDQTITLSPSEQSYVWADVTPNGLVIDGLLLDKSDFAFDHYNMVKDFIALSKSRLMYNPTVITTIYDKANCSLTMREIKSIYAQFDDSFREMSLTTFERKVTAKNAKLFTPIGKYLDVKTRTGIRTTRLFTFE